MSLNKRLTENDITRYFKSWSGDLKICVGNDWYEIAPSEVCTELLAALKFKHGLNLELTAEGKIERLVVNRYKNVDPVLTEKLDKVKDVMNKANEQMNLHGSAMIEMDKDGNIKVLDIKEIFKKDTE